MIKEREFFLTSRFIKFMRNNKSFTLLELAVAIFILIGGILGVMHAYLAFAGLAQFSKNISLAEEVASAKMEDIRSDSFDDVDSYEGIFFPNLNDPYPQDISYQGLDYRGLVYVDDISSDLKQVTVIICWRQGERTIGADWVFGANPDITAHPRPSSPVTLTTLITRR